MVFGLIPVRNGSKRIEDKAFAELYGRPMLEYTVRAAELSCLRKTFISTNYDRDKINSVVENHQKIEYIRRDDKYCNNKVSSLSAIDDLYDKDLINSEDIICLLQSTCPLRSYADIDNSVSKYLVNKDKDVVLSVTDAYPLKKLYYEELEKVSGDCTPYSYQEEKNIYVRNSSIYIFKVSVYLEDRTIFKRPFAVYHMPKIRSIDIDTPEDLLIAEGIIRAGGMLDERHDRPENGYNYISRCANWA